MSLGLYLSMWFYLTHYIINYIKNCDFLIYFLPYPVAASLERIVCLKKHSNLKTGRNMTWQWYTVLGLIQVLNLGKR